MDHESRRAQRHRSRVAAKRRRTLLVGGAVAVVLLGAGTVFVVVRDDGDEQEAALPSIVLGDYSISGNLAVEAGDVTFAVSNLGGVAHNVGVRGGPITGDLAPGGTSQLELADLPPGTYELFCDISDHAERGMVATLQVLAPTTTS